jgi:catechol 2,3-dioxygenase-like lactoylglutathione lyase family enzyme
MSDHRPVFSFSHAAVRVRDLEATVAFYTAALGFEVTDRGELNGSELVFLSRDPGEHHQLVFVGGGGGQATGTPGTLEHLAFRLPSLAALRAARDGLRRAGAADLQCVTHGTTWSVYCRDPEGARVELFVDTPWYVPQPLRLPVDLDLPEDELRRRTEARLREEPGFMPIEAWRQRRERRRPMPSG